jgi:two-component system, OmpR family, sensor histidine kinase MprB
VTLRTRIAAVASLSVAVAVLAAAIGLYVAVRSNLRGEIDRSLRERAQAFAPPQGTGPGSDRGPGPGADGGSGSGSEGASGPGSEGASGPGHRVPPRAEGPSGPGRGVGSGPYAEVGFDHPGGNVSSGGPSQGGGQGSPSGYGAPRHFPGTVQPRPFGAASGYVQFISPEGATEVPGGQGPSRTPIALTALDRAIASRGSGSSLTDRTVQGTHLRVLTTGTGSNGAVLVALPLTDVQHELDRLLLILAVIGGCGIVLAALLGAVVARTALAPITRFTRRTESLTGSLDLSRRLDVEGRDELARLAQSFNSTLDALERSVQAQRHLIADASHELRTPIASLRANIQILGDAARLPAQEQESLRRDIVDELDDLTALVGDVVELARGATPDAAPDDVRLDEVVENAVRRTRRRGDLRFELDLEPTIVSGRADRVDRAVSNLLDNARRWSPPDASVDVVLEDGVLTVRDHGPGFQEADLPFVFDRFYRAEGARKLPGSGLGLAIVRHAAEASGGYAEAANAPGGGALLRVSFGSSFRLTEGQR